MWASRETWTRIALGGVIAVALAYFSWRLKFMLGTVLLAAVLAYVLKPPVDWLSSRRFRERQAISRTFATGLVYLAVGLIIWQLVALLAPAIQSDLDRFRSSWRAAVERVPALASRFEQAYERSVPGEWRTAIDKQAAKMRDAAVEQAKKAVTATLRSAWLAVELFLVPVLAFFFLSDPKSLKDSCLFFVPPTQRPRVEEVLHEVDQVFDRYLQGQVILCLVAFVVTTAALRLLHMEFALTLGLFAGITRALPIVGPVFGGIPIVLLGLAKSPALGLWLLVGFSGLHFFESKYLMPRVLGFKLGLHPVLVILSLLVGGEFFGLVGMFLAAPALAVIQRLLGQSRKETPPAVKA